MLTALLVLFFLLVILMALVFLTQRHVIQRLDALAYEVRGLKQSLPPPGVGGGGRRWPTQEELTAARNRMDSFGTARPGKPS
jgi:hypothetical protein